MIRLLAFLPLLTLACGSDGGGPVSVDPGDGTQGLQVNARISIEGSTADFSVEVRRGGAAVATATVEIESDAGTVSPAHTAGGLFEGSQGGWNDYYLLRVTDGEDWLDGGLAAPAIPELLSPAPAEAIDPHTAEGGVVEIVWGGDSAHQARVKTKEFDWEGPDEGRLEIPASAFVEPDQELEIQRTNQMGLDGGDVGSDMRVSVKEKLTLIVVNPY